MRDVKILVDTGMLARALFDAELYAEAEVLGEGNLDRTERVLSVMWEKTKPEVKQRAEEQAIALMSFLATYEGCPYTWEAHEGPPSLSREQRRDIASAAVTLTVSNTGIGDAPTFKIAKSGTGVMTWLSQNCGD